MRPPLQVSKRITSKDLVYGLAAKLGVEDHYVAAEIRERKETDVALKVSPCSDLNLVES